MSLSSTTTTASHSCPCATDARCWTAHGGADRSEDGWVRRCHGVVVVDDHWFLAPDGHAEPIPAAA